MNIVELIRLEESDQGTIGVLKINKKIFCNTLEPPDRENAQNISSIPAKQYKVEPVLSPRFGNTFEISDVTGRTHVLFHAGNTVDHTAGCILLGSAVGKLNSGKRAVLNSGNTFKQFLAKMDGTPFHLTIMEVY